MGMRVVSTEPGLFGQKHSRRRTKFVKPRATVRCSSGE